MQTVFSIAVDAFAYGMVLFVISIGLSVTMGLMRVVNLAHGAFAMIGGYIASYAARDLGLAYAVAVIAAIVVTILVAIPLERFLYRRIYGAPELTQVLMTIGITFCVIGLANYAMGPTLKTIPLPAALQGSADLGFRTIPVHRLFVIFCGLAVALVQFDRAPPVRHRGPADVREVRRGRSGRRLRRVEEDRDVVREPVGRREVWLSVVVELADRDLERRVAGLGATR